MSAINIPINTPSVVPVPGANTVGPAPDPTAVAGSIPVSPVSTSSAPTLDASQTGYDLTIQGDVDPSTLLPADFDIESWSPALFAKYGDFEGNDCYASEYTQLPFSPSYFSRAGPRDFKILDWGWGTGPSSFFVQAKKTVGFDVRLPVIALSIGAIGLALYYWTKKKR
jgi:hypothetical protein